MFRKKLLTCVGILATLSAQGLRAESRPHISVGVIVALTGLAAQTGNAIRRGIELADAEFDRDDHVTFVVEDDNFQAKNAVSAAQKLIIEDKVSALITFSGSTSLAVSAIAESRRVPMIAITPLTKVSTDRSFVATLFVPNHASLELLRKAIKRSPHDRIAIITSTQDALLQIREQLRASLSSNVVFDEEVTPGDADLLSTITRLLSAKPDVVVNLTLPPQVSTVARLLRERRFAGRHVGAPPMYNFSEIKAAAGALAGANLSGPRVDRAAKFPRDYFARFGEQIIPEAVFGYDAARLIIESSNSAEGIASIVRANAFSGLAGVYPKSAANQYEVPGELKVITASGQIEAVGEAVSQR